MTRLWLIGLIRHRPGSLLASIAGIAIAVALLASLGSFLSAARASMTLRAAANVAVDWQIQLAPGADQKAALATTRKSNGVTSAFPVGFAQSTGLRATTQGTTQTTGSGVVLGLPSKYAATFPGQIRYLTGAHQGVLIAQQTASNLHIVPGDNVSIGLAGSAPVVVRIAGVVDLPQANSLFQVVGAAPQQQPVAPPDNVILLPEAAFHSLAAHLALSKPGDVTTQLHVKRSHALPADPVVSYVNVTQAAHNLEATLSGTGKIGDNLGAALDAARGDSSYATVLFLFLGLPGVVLSGMLTVSIANTGAGQRRRDQALLRTRGANTKTVTRLVVAESLLVGAAGGIVGLATSSIIGMVAFGSAGFGASSTSALLWPAAAFSAGLAISSLAVLLPALRDFRSLVVTDARVQITAQKRPLWMRAYLDLGLLAVAGIILYITTRTGYSLVLAPEGVASIQVNYWAFFGPGLLWIGAGLLIWRLTSILMTRTGLLARSLRPIAKNLATTASSSMSRQRSLLGRATVVFALALAFAGSTAVFNATYQQQAEVDAQLTNGSDVTVTQTAGTNLTTVEMSRLASIPGVRAVEPLQHRYVYVGNDLQDLFGIRPGTITKATTLQDAYFQDGTAKQLLARLAAQPDAVLVSAETVKDFQLKPGELLRLRLQNPATKQLRMVPFHYVGVVNEFPTAPKDSFFVANASYITRATGTDAVSSFLVNTGGQPSRSVTQSIAKTAGSSASVTAIGTARRSVGSSLTSVDLKGLSQLELVFALLLAAASGGLVFALGLAQRRRTFAIATILGARRQQLRQLVLAEAAVIATIGTLAGLSLGSGLSTALIAVLTGVFDPPPAFVTIPWTFLVVSFVTAVATMLVAALLSTRVSQRPAVEALRET